MAELILTDKEKAAALWSDLEDAALGALVKRKISLIESCSEQLDQITPFSAAMMLCLAAQHAGADKASFDIDGLKKDGKALGNWRITAERVPDGAPGMADC